MIEQIVDNIVIGFKCIVGIAVIVILWPLVILILNGALQILLLLSGYVLLAILVCVLAYMLGAIINRAKGRWAKRGKNRDETICL